VELKENETVEYLDAGSVPFVGLMDELVGIRGYRASAIMGSDGELLYSNTTNRDINYNFSMMIEVLNSLFGKVCNLTEKSGFMACAEVALRTGDEVMVVRCSGENCLVGIRLFVVVDEQGNVILMQKRLAYLLPLIMRCLTWEPDNLVPLYMREAAWRKRSEKVLQSN